MKNIILLIGVLLGAPLHAQYYKATLQEDFSIVVEEVTVPTSVSERNESFEQLPGFPKGMLANPTFKNMRNITLADLDQDSINEILLATDSKLLVYSGDSLLWERDLSGTAIFPPSVADINYDGQLEIVQTTGGVPSAGRIYAVSATGEDLPGWPVNFSDHWILTAAARSDLDGDNRMEIIILERNSPGGLIHILTSTGESYNDQWPVSVPATPAVTPSVGDVDNDGEKEIVVYSTETRYIFDQQGQPKAGFPITTDPDQRYSFQSPILVDFDEDQLLEVVGATHGDTQNPKPQFYVMNYDGTDYPGWPKAVPDDSWTFSTPTVVQIDSVWQIFMSRPISTFEDEMLYAWDPEGNLTEGFPIVKPGGLEGIISVADVDDDGGYELIFSSNIIDSLGQGYIHAYELDGTTEVEGFPIRTRGWTFLNGAAIDDVNNDGMMDLTALSYTQTFGQGIDSTYLNVFDLGVPYAPEKVLWDTYKGSNTRTGLVGEEPVPFVVNTTAIEQVRDWKILPNPAAQYTSLSIAIEEPISLAIRLVDLNGRVVQDIMAEQLPAGRHIIPVLLNQIPSGVYFIQLVLDNKSLESKKIIISK